VLRWVAPALTLCLLLVAGATAQQLGWVDNWIDNSGTTSGSTSGSTAVPEPWQAAVPSPAALAPPEAVASQTLVGRALAGQLRAADLGRNVRVEVAGLTGDPLVSRGSGPITPASTNKLLTTAAALHVLGAEATFATTLVAPRPGELVLVGGGDPLLGSAPTRSATLHRADLTTLATAAAAALTGAGTTSVTLAYDDSLFTGPATSPTWPSSYVSEGVVSPVGALRADAGILPGGARDLSPALTATRVVAAELGKHGIAVTGRIRRATADSDGGTEVAVVHSAPVREIVEHTLQTSDNDAAEMIGHLVGAHAGDGSFDGAAAATAAALGNLGVPLDGVELHDGSGLSRADQLTSAALTAVLRLATTDPDLQALDYGLPVAGFSGSLAGRYADDSSDAGAGTVRAKTGTLTGVSGLAGYVTTADGISLTYVVLADAVPVARTLAARRSLDDAAAALAACVCAG
jgi:D-alanyl-D-alanine carboxypeptidase/D-alanyl-D-alanine-endopeptidase (penicillin-binding protein 4)